MQKVIVTPTPGISEYHLLQSSIIFLFHLLTKAAMHHKYHAHLLGRSPIEFSRTYFMHRNVPSYRSNQKFRGMDSQCVAYKMCVLER